MSNSCTNRKWT